MAGLGLDDTAISTATEHRVPRSLPIDEHCYESFQHEFDEEICKVLGRPVPEIQPTDLGRHGWGLTTSRADPTGNYILSSSISTSRNLRGYRFPHALQTHERLEVEQVLDKALTALNGPLKGTYRHLPEQWSGTMDDAGASSEQTLDSIVENPGGRGMFCSNSSALTALVNSPDSHLCARVRRSGDALQPAFRELVRALDSVANSVRRGDDPESPKRPGSPTKWPGSPSKFDATSPRRLDAPRSPERSKVYAYSQRLGFLTSDLSNIGTAMDISVIVRLPLLSRQSGATAWRDWAASQGLSVTPKENAESGIYQATNIERLGISEVDLVNLSIEVLGQLVQMEQHLEQGLSVDELLQQRIDNHLAEKAQSVPQLAQVELSDSANQKQKWLRASLIALALAMAVTAFCGEDFSERSSTCRASLAVGSACCLAIALLGPKRTDPEGKSRPGPFSHLLWGL